jgi:hypothetical protein
MTSSGPGKARAGSAARLHLIGDLIFGIKRLDVGLHAQQRAAIARPQFRRDPAAQQAIDLEGGG